jgi:hypothetical protein
MTCSRNKKSVGGWPVREHDVTTLTADELNRARRELTASLALARPGSPVRTPVLARISAIDAKLTERSTPARPAPEQHTHD